MLRERAGRGRDDVGARHRLQCDGVCTSAADGRSYGRMAETEQKLLLRRYGVGVGRSCRSCAWRWRMGRSCGGMCRQCAFPPDGREICTGDARGKGGADRAFRIDRCVWAYGWASVGGKSCDGLPSCVCGGTCSMRRACCGKGVGWCRTHECARTGRRGVYLVNADSIWSVRADRMA